MRRNYWLSMVFATSLILVSTGALDACPQACINQCIAAQRQALAPAADTNHINSYQQTLYQDQGTLSRDMQNNQNNQNNQNANAIVNDNNAIDDDNDLIAQAQANLLTDTAALAQDIVTLAACYIRNMN